MLSNEQKQAIASSVRAIRRTLEDDLSRQLRGVYGIHPELTPAEVVEPPEALGDISPTDLYLRAVMVDALTHLADRSGQTLGVGASELLRHAVASITNRLVALRLAEGLGSIPPAISNGVASRACKEVLDLFPLLANSPDAYGIVLSAIDDELAVAAPRLFDRLNPVADLQPSSAALDAAVKLLNAPSLADVWTTPETLGWAYQFFNSDDERRDMREEAASPRTSEELAVRNQFFTPRYVVDWLVDRTLGCLIASIEELPVSERVGAFEQLRVLDPAVGSGHFLLGCYDCLEAAYLRAGLDERSSAPRILRSLFGIEIDPRAAQIAQFALVLRASVAASLSELDPPGIATAQPLADDDSHVEQIMRGLTPDVRDVFSSLVQASADAPILGSLLLLERDVSERLATRSQEPQLGDVGMTVEQAKHELTQALADLVKAVELHPAQRLAAIDASDATRFMEILDQRYDVVLMNPPFGSGVPETERYLRAAYKAPHRDLYAYFIERGLQLLVPGGRLGAITNRTFAIRRSYEKYRRWLLSSAALDDFLDLGWGVLDAQVEVAAYVLRLGEPAGINFIDARDDAKGQELSAPLEELPRFELDQEVVRRMPGATFLYALHPDAAAWTARAPALAEAAHPGEGIHAPGSDRYFRLWWETIGSDNSWVCIANGGPHAPFLRDWKLVADWSSEAQRAYNKTNEDWYFHTGLSWGKRSTYLNVQPLPPGVALTAEGHGLHLGSDAADIDEDQNRLYALLGLLNSRPYIYLIEHTSGLQKNSGYIGSLPLEVDTLDDERLQQLSRAIVAALNQLRVVDETSRHFIGLPAIAWSKEEGVTMGLSETSLRRLEIQEEVLRRYAELDDVVIDLLGIPELQASLDRELGRVLAGDDATDPGRASLSDRYFVIGEEYGQLERQKAKGEEPVGDVRLEAIAAMSFFVGLTFGRYSADDAAGDAFGPFDRLPERSPAMLTTPTRSAFLVDDLSADDDIVRLIKEAAQAERLGGLLEEVEGALGGDIRAYLRRHFSGDLVRRYRYGRRIAPPYWHLAVPSLTWGVWLDAGRLNREVLFGIDRHAAAAVSAVRSRLEGSPRGQDRAARENVERLEALFHELQEFRRLTSEIAQSGWEPDLDDGFPLVATPLVELLAAGEWKREVLKHRKAVEGGKADWADVSKSYFK